MAEAQSKPSNSASAALIMPPDHLRLSLIKGEHKWIFRWEAGAQAQIIERVAELARDPNIPFDWFDAAAICKHIAKPPGAAATGTSCASAPSIDPSGDLPNQK